VKALKEKSVSIRLLPEDYAKLEAHARRQSSHPASIGSLAVSHYLRRRDHPAIDFQDLPDGGYVARLAGRRLSVWLVCQTVREAGSVKAAAKGLAVPEALIVAAQAYAAEYPDEIARDAKQGRAPVRDEG
jgi:hypothetical protein